MDDNFGIQRVGSHIDHDLEKGSLTQQKLKNIIGGFSLHCEIMSGPKRCTIIVNEHSGTTMFFANSGEERMWLNKHASKVQTRSNFSKYEITTVD